MRLTLRTLMAWRDGILPDADRVELGAKVEASPVAPGLLARMDEVGKRPELPAPRTDGRGLADDANTVAEFLDNTLATERLETFERICIDSDIHLAEAADCHAILAELTCDPEAIASLGAEPRRRLLTRVSRQLREPEEQAGHEEAAALVEVLRTATGRPNRPPRQPASPGAWLSAAAGILLLVALAILLVRVTVWPANPGRPQGTGRAPVRDHAGRPPQLPGAAGEAQAVAQNQAQSRDLARADMKPALPEPVREAKPLAAGESGTAPPVPVPPPSADPAIPGAAVGADPASAPPVPPAPASGLLAAPVVPLPSMEGEKDSPPRAEPDRPPAAGPVPSRALLVDGGPALRRARGDAAAAWQAVVAGAPLNDGDEVVVPTYSYPRFERGEITFRLFPGTSAVLSSDRDGTPRLEVIFGRAVAWTEADNALVGIAAGGLCGTLGLTIRQPVAIDVTLDREPGTEPAVVPPGRRATLRTSGGGRWRQTEIDGDRPGTLLTGLPAEQPLPPRAGLAWESAAPVAARILPPAPEPAWLTHARPAGPVERLAAVAIAGALVPERPAEEALRALADDRRIENRMAAAATLALVGAYDPLVALLCDDAPASRLLDGQWQSLEASTVPLALARGANAAAALRRSFAALGPPGREADLFLMARGLAAGDLRDGAAAELVAWLEDPALVVRRYAIKNLTAILPDPDQATRDYRPDRSVRLNDKGIAWWRGRLASGGLAGAAEGDPEP